MSSTAIVTDVPATTASDKFVRAVRLTRKRMPSLGKFQQRGFLWRENNNVFGLNSPLGYKTAGALVKSFLTYPAKNMGLKNG